MTELLRTPSEFTSPPSSAWIRFLRSYGPTPNNTNLFDEYVTGALGRAKVQPITLSSPILEKIKERVTSGVDGSILIAGTAGDGKTYHCRSLWSFLGGSFQAWSEPSIVKNLELPEGRHAIFVKDLSELDDQQSDEILEIFEQSVLGTENSRFVVIAANHGQILERLRDMGNRQNREHPLRKSIQDVFLLAGEPPEKLAIFDLSRTAHRNSMEDVLRVVAEHPEWEKCASCPLQTDGRICLILENRSRLLTASDNGRFAKRLGDLVEIASLNGWHLPIRDLLALVSNIILGHKEAKEGLMTCADIARMQLNQLLEQGSLYGNVFGSNLPKRRAMDRPVFKALSSFGIGYETTNGMDGLLVYGSDDTNLKAAFSRLIGHDQIYGATLSFLAAQHTYLEGDEEARLESGAFSFLERLGAQRRRLYFTLPEDESDYNYWNLTAFQFAGDYLVMTKALLEKVPVNEAIRSRLVVGLNRVMTGLLVENNDVIFVASSGGFTQSRVSVLCDTKASARRKGGIGMAIKLDARTGQPQVDISLAKDAGNSVKLDLTPIRFEFLCRVAEGALPGSFSNECLEDMLAFKAKLLRKAEIIRIQIDNEDDDEPGSGDGALTLNFIEIEQNGHGFSRPVTVRIGE